MEKLYNSSDVFYSNVTFIDRLVMHRSFWWWRTLWIHKYRTSKFMLKKKATARFFFFVDKRHILFFGRFFFSSIWAHNIHSFIFFARIFTFLPLVLVYLVTLSSFFFFSLLVYTRIYLRVDGLLAEHDFCQGYFRFDATIYSMIFVKKKFFF